MRRLLSICLAFTCLVAVTPLDSHAQNFIGTKPIDLLFNPNTPTIWHKLGVPQSVGRFKKFRESTVNRKGNHPERESKPRLLKLTDPANLAPDAPQALKMAAEIKKAEDLAPQKIKALKYLGTIGCGCYNKKTADGVEAALLEAMEDCTPGVRTEALNVVLKQVSGQCACSCGGGCNTKSCCSAKIYKKLEAIALKTDDSGCPLEPDAGVRSLAQQVLNACPYPKMDAPVKKINRIESTESPDAKSIMDTDDEARNSFRNRSSSQVGFQLSSSRRTGASGFTATPLVNQAMLDQLEVTGVVRSIKSENGFATIEFDQPYAFPQGMDVVIATGPEHASFGRIETTETGTAVVKIEDEKMVKHLKPNARIRLGIIE